MSEAPKTLCLIHFLGWENSLFPLLALWGNKNWLSRMKVENLEKNSEQNGLKGLQVVQFECPRHWNPSVSSILGDGKFSQLPLLALWGNKNWLQSMKVKELEIFQSKIGLKGCKWSSLNAKGTGNPLSHPVLELRNCPFPNIGSLG